MTGHALPQPRGKRSASVLSASRGAIFPRLVLHSTNPHLRSTYRGIPLRLDLVPDTQALHLLLRGRPASGTYRWVGFLLKGSTPVPAELSQCVK